MMKNYKVYKSNTCLEYKLNAYDQCMEVFKKFRKRHPKIHPSHNYKEYNIFSIAEGNAFFYDLLKEIRNCFVDFSGADLSKERYWFHSWINVDDENSLDKSFGFWHSHLCDYHGYVTITPNDTITEFRNWKIFNEPANIYVGYGMTEHRVIKKEEKIFNGEFYRISIAFNIYSEKKYTEQNDNSIFPLI
jgi:hypothetical protein